MARPKIATTSLCGCFGCHMSLLDLDESLLELVARVDFDRSPIDDLKSFTGPVDIGLVEGGCCNEENVKVLRDFRAHCRLLVSVGDCAISGGVPALRNRVPLDECLREAFVDGPTVENPSGRMPDDAELPRLLDRVCPNHEVVHVDGYLPGCPPAPEAIRQAILALLEGRTPELPYELVKYD